MRYRINGPVDDLNFLNQQHVRNTLLADLLFIILNAQT